MIPIEQRLLDLSKIASLYGWAVDGHCLEAQEGSLRTKDITKGLEEMDKKVADLTWQGPSGQVGLKQVCATNCVWTIQHKGDQPDNAPLGMVIAFVDDLIAVGNQIYLDGMKAELINYM